MNSSLSAPSHESAAALRRLLLDKVHVEPAVGAGRAGTPTPLALSRQLLRPLHTAPAGLLECWARCPRGHAVISAAREGYQPGEQAVGRRRLEAVAWVHVDSLAGAARLAAPLAALFDHLLGSDAAAHGPRFSDGFGRSAAWAEAAGALLRQFALGYAPGLPSCAAYFAWGLSEFLASPRELQVADPGLERLLRRTVFSASFWAAQDANG